MMKMNYCYYLIIILRNVGGSIGVIDCLLFWAIFDLRFGLLFVAIYSIFVLTLLLHLFVYFHAVPQLNRFITFHNTPLPTFQLA